MENKDNFYKTIDQATIEVIQGDITQQETEAIVNAANKTLLGGGGVDGAIHRAAGAELLQECKTLGGCRTGEAKITSGYNLKAKYVIHTVGPVYSGSEKDSQLLEACYFNSLRLAAEKGIKSISFPAISTGVYRYPVKEAANIAISTIIKFLKENKEINSVKIILFSKESFEIHRAALEKQLNE